MTHVARTYGAVLHAYLADPGEETLRAAYELGREAVRAEDSLLDLCIAHHDALAAELAPRSAGDAPATARAAGEFLLECVSAYEMVRRGFREVHETAQAERRQADMLRQLSGFLSDSSLAARSADAFAEVRQLVAEQAREFAGAECCLVTTRRVSGRAEWSASHPPGTAWQAWVRWTELEVVDAAVRTADGPLRLSGAQAAALLAAPAAREDRPAVELRGWLGASLTSLGGEPLGALHLVNRLEGEFTALDEAVAVHLAQMAAAAVERAQLYVAGR